jgi:hypothetical protein
MEASMRSSNIAMVFGIVGMAFLAGQASAGNTAVQGNTAPTKGVNAGTGTTKGGIVERNTAPIKGVNAPDNPPTHGGGGHH